MFLRTPRPSSHRFRQRSPLVPLALTLLSGAALGACDVPPEEVGQADPERVASAATKTFGFLEDRLGRKDVLTLTTSADVAKKRADLISIVWGSEGFPKTKRAIPQPTAPNCKIDGLVNLGKTEELHHTVEGIEGLACHWVPSARSNNRLVIVHSGHACDLNDHSDPFLSDNLRDDGQPGYVFGMSRTIRALLLDGYSVLGVYMPNYRPGACVPNVPDHPALVKQPMTMGTAHKLFLEPIAASLNYLETSWQSRGFPQYRQFDMVGLSGGGWTTGVYAALDTRIRISIPVAGSMPFEFWAPPWGEGEEDEQILASFYGSRPDGKSIMNRDLYLMGAHGGRRQIQILNRFDGCCFWQGWNPPPADVPWEDKVHGYEQQIRERLVSMGDLGVFRLEIDEAPQMQHTISRNAIANVILAELNGARRPIGAASASDAFVRGMNGKMWRYAGNTLANTGLTMVGAPAVVYNGEHALDVFYRDHKNRLTQAWQSGSLWQTRSLRDGMVGDPAAVSWGPNRWDVIAYGADYVLYHFSSDAPTTAKPMPAKGLGTPVLLSSGSNKLDAFIRGLSDDVFHLEWNGSGWNIVGLDGSIFGTPTAVVTPDGPTRRVFVFGRDNKLWQRTRAGTGNWSGWQSVSTAANAAGVSLFGLPSAALTTSGSASVAARTEATSVYSFVSSGSSGQSWSPLNRYGEITASPTAVPTGVFARGMGGALCFHDGSSWICKGGQFE